MDYDSFDGVLHYIFRSTLGDSWFKPTEENISAGVCLRTAPGQFRTFPYENQYLAPFEAAVRILNPLIAVKVRSAAAHSALGTVPENATFIYIDDNTRIQILDTINHLPKADKEQCGAFIRDEHVLVVWCDSLEQIVPLCNDFDEKMMKLVWRSRNHNHTPSLVTSPSNSSAPSTTPSNINLTEKIKSGNDVALAIAVESLQEKQKITTVEDVGSNPDSVAGTTKKRWGWGGWRLSPKKTASPSVSDPEKAHERLPRPIRLFAPLYTGLGAGLALFFIACGVLVLLQEWRLDNDYKRFALLVTAPVLLCVSLFFALQIVTTASMLIGPIAQYHENSRYYSAIKPEPNSDVDRCLPHVTIEMPVYKESLEETIAPSVFSLKKAMQTYARQGGTSAIFIHDDGLQSLGKEEQEKRIRFYADHNIGWVARPPHSDAPDGFKRAGRFKKASNMNYGLQLSLSMEKHILALEASEEKFDGSYSLEEKALEMAIEESYQSTGGKWKPLAKNARSLRIGEIILIVDSDTIVPEDCFRDAARELTECPDVAIIQHESDVIQVAHHFFENGIAHFTRRINKCISLACSNGDVAPFVGHNAFLRWSAIQDAAFIDHDGISKIWSETNVSEDFDMALRLQLKGYIIRWANYSAGGFKEGVSLTVDDELNRWQKYSYGCNELIFNPLKDWWRLGPITKQLRIFLWSSAPVHYKLTMLSYMFSYYGIAGSATLAIVNYFLLGLSMDVDGYYMHSFEILLACIVVFPGGGNAAYTIFEYRLGARDLFSSALENFAYVPFFWFFFGGLSIHLSIALLAHLFSYNITWGATKKEVERSNFWIEVPKIGRRYWFVFLISLLSIVVIVVLSTGLVPPAWRIPSTSWGVILPLAITASGHILFPIVLNPWLMIFSY
ncbi:glycosyl transferase family group 2-domain-containing protein [Crepidotus variabilis]|uniref:Glycosyl transferase family group 2-domain-containing protein n=1 Tax=Crepidotus variabilis TaxID=179855 RepID=A0A9P6EKF4_9AGAR|nr:glycosyl transferase family group 2-domain-containing protein [Crepidotus variabilis]